MTRVEEIMETEVVTLDPETTVLEAARILSKHGIGGAPVLDRSGRLMGVLSSSDILRLKARDAEIRGDHYPFDPAEALDPDTGAASSPRWFYFGPEHPATAPPVPEDGAPPDSLEECTVKDLMSNRRYAVSPGTSVRALARFLLEKEIHRALVLENDHLVGLVTSFDVLRVVAEGEAEPGHHAS